MTGLRYCDCTCADRCPNGRTGSAPRCAIFVKEYDDFDDLEEERTPLQLGIDYGLIPSAFLAIAAILVWIAMAAVWSSTHMGLEIISLIR